MSITPWMMGVKDPFSRKLQLHFSESDLAVSMSAQKQLPGRSPRANYTDRAMPLVRKVSTGVNHLKYPF
jgi:hypothetical protein